MTTTLSSGTTTLSLPDDLDWPDRNSWEPVTQVVAPTLTGALVVENYTLQAGREITLMGYEDRAWVPRTTVEQLRAWAAIAGQQLTLSLEGVTHTVVFRHQQPPALDARPLYGVANPADDWPHTLTLKLMEV
jgi:hypothetical protein